MSLLPPVFIELKANAKEFMTAMGEARHEVSKLEKEGSGHFDKLASVGKASLFAIGTASIAVGGIALHMADEFEGSHAKLQQALKNTGVSFDQYAVPIGAAQKKMEQFGFTNAQTQEALANLTIATGDPKKALADLGLAADLAKTKHIDLAQAAIGVAKAEEGNLRALKQMGIDLPVAASSALILATAHTSLAKATANATDFLKLHTDAANSGSKSNAQYEKLLGKVSDAQAKVNAVAGAGKEIMTALSEKIGGQAAAAAETFAGKMAALKAQSEDVGKNIGMVLVPILEKLMTAVKGVVDWLGKHKVIAEALGAVIVTVLTVAISAYLLKLVQAGIASAKTFATDIAKGAIWVATKVAQYAAVAVAAIASAVSTAAAWVAANATMILASGGIILALGAVVVAALYLHKHWKQIWHDIKQWIADGWAFIKKHTVLIAIAFGPVGIAIKVFADHWSSIWNGIKSVISEVAKVIHSIIGGITSAIHDVTSAISAVTNNPIVKGIGGAISGVENFFSGGSSSSASHPVIRAPHVTPYSRANAARSHPGTSAGITVHVNVAGSVTAEGDLVTKVRDGLGQGMRRRGLDPASLGL